MDLTWATATEYNNQGFNVEKSDTAIDFVKIGFAEGNGNSAEIQRYYFSDLNAYHTSYYRLQQVDYDGAYQYGPDIRVDIEGDEFMYVLSQSRERRIFGCAWWVGGQQLYIKADF